MSNKDEKEVLLKVDHLCQYFPLGRKNLKAVHNVSFDIHKGEVFGLVGESGCGKTTTGRSIIKLYDITGGNIYFKGQRIAAGQMWYKKRIAEAKKIFAEKKKEILTKRALADQPDQYGNVISDEMKAELDKNLKADIAKITKERDETISARRKEMAKSIYDHKHCDREFAKRQVAAITKKYTKLLDKETDPAKKETLQKEFNNQIRLAKKSKLVTQIQMIFQDPIGSLNPRMTVKDIISEGLKIKGIKDKEYIDNKVYEILDLVGLQKEHATRYPHEFSGGQRQRIGIARSVVMEPEMIIADEPVSALDVSIQAQVINLLNNLRDKLGLTILFIAHDLSVVKYFSDRIGVMYYGDLVELADSDELFAHPLHPYTKSLLSAIPLPDPEYEKKRKRIVYNPLAEHDYSVNRPSLREIRPGHFVYCNDEEEKRLKEAVGNGQ